MKNKNIKTSIILSVLLAMVSCKSGLFTDDLALNIRNLTEQNQSLKIVNNPKSDSLIITVDAGDTIYYVWKNPIVGNEGSFDIIVGNDTVGGFYYTNGSILGTDPSWLTLAG